MVLEYAFNTKGMAVTVLRGLSYGRGGCGKTHFIGTFPKPLILSPVSEGGIVTLRNQDAMAIEIHDSTDMYGALEELAALNVKGTLKQHYESLIFDSISLYSDLYVHEILRKAKIPTMRKSDWGLVDSHIRALTELAHALPLNVWWVALEDLIRDADGEVIKGMPMIYGKRNAKLVAAVDVVLHHEVIHGSAKQPSIYQAHARQHGVYEAKNRFGKLPSPLVNPTYAGIRAGIGI